MTWKCENCETFNDESHLECELCGWAWPSDRIWTCTSCAHKNPAFLHACQECQESAPPGAQWKLPDTDSIQEEKDPKEIAKPLWQAPGHISASGSREVPVYVKKEWYRILSIEQWLGLTVFLVIGGVLWYQRGEPLFFLLSAVSGLASVFTERRYKFITPKPTPTQPVIPPGLRLKDHRQESFSVDQYEEGHNHAINSLHFNFDGYTLGSTDINGSFILWDAQTGEKIHQFKTKDRQKNRLFTISNHGIAQTRRQLKIRTFDRSQKTSIEYDENSDLKIVLKAPGGKTLIGITETEEILRWNLNKAFKDPKSTKPALTPTELKITSAALAPNSQRLLTGTSTGEVHFWAPKGLSINHKHMEKAGDRPVTTLSYRDKEFSYAAGLEGGKIFISIRGEEFERRHIELYLPIEGRNVAGITWLQGDQSHYLIAGDDHGDLWIWDWRAKALAGHFQTPIKTITALQYDPYYKRIAVGGQPGHLCVYTWQDLDARMKIRQLSAQIAR